MAAGVSVAAAAVVIALLVLPTLVGSRPTTSANPGTPPSVARLRVALSSGNALAVARADANLLREAKTIADPEQNDAVAAHVEAIQFLRAHPSAAAAAELPTPSSTVPPSKDPAPPSTTIAPGRDPVPSSDTPLPDVAPPVPVPTTPAPGPPRVAIVAVVARLDGTFDVDFTVSGFTPDASGAPGTHSVRFSFDDGRSPTTWVGPSPWSFPLGNGVAYRQVCVHVADSAGVEDLSTGGCHDIV